MGMRPALRAETLSRSLSTQTTSLPRSAKTAPVTSPTYPVPTTQMFMRSRTRGHQDTKRSPRRPPLWGSQHPSEDAPEEALGHHPREEQEEVEVREKKEG